MPTARHGIKLVWFENRIWAIGGNVGVATKVESYDPTTDTWKAEASLTTSRMWSVAWVTKGKIYTEVVSYGSPLIPLRFMTQQQNNGQIQEAFLKINMLRCRCPER